MENLIEQNIFPKKDTGREMPERIGIMMDGKDISNESEIDFEDILGDKGTCKLVFRYGKKELELFIEDAFGGKIVAYGGIENIGVQEESKKNETTLIYGRVRAILQEAANQINLPVYYTLATHFILPDGKPNPMRKWASSEKRGRAIFNWTTTRIDENNKCAYFQKVFYPKEQQFKKAV